MRSSSSFFAHIGFNKQIDENGRLVLNLPITKELLTETGDIPTGLFSTMLDIIIGSTIAEEVQQSTSTLSLNLHYFNLKNLGPYTSTASITYRDNKIITGEGIIRNTHGEIAAKAAGTFKILSPATEGR
ncbi:PaaI family thioesterase [Halobacillus massiliensis]|uniref:PaaI family thioesterase n=1 Tax=Halobacillus massiliensis TaxID=1926286 RepID=UPI0009E31E77|nr:hypothetical protein [Halobacillus massiliensis]